MVAAYRHSLRPLPRRSCGFRNVSGRPAPGADRLPGISVRPAENALTRDLAVPVAAITGGLLLAILGQQYAATSGHVFTLGSVGLNWVTTQMVLIGGAVAVVRLAWRRHDR